MRGIIISLLLFTLSAQAEDTFSRPLPTVGMSYILCDVTRSIDQKVFGMPKWTSWIFGAVMSSAVVYSMRMGESGRLTNSEIARTVGYNMVGNVGVSLKIRLFEGGDR